jgi:predicted lipoprotein with Yx(FWY)xxD motif
MKRRHTRLASCAAPVILTLALGACGGSTQSDHGTTAGGDDHTPTVAVKQIDGVGTVLVDDHGHALYASDQEADGKVRCKDDCTTFWDPLRASTSQPTAGSAVTGQLAVIRRPDGTRQITYDRKPLYRFTEDPGPGEVTGDNFKDSFAGTSFTWHAITSDGSSQSKPGPAKPGPGY